MLDWKVPIIVAFIEGITHFGSFQGDSPGYVDLVKVFRGTAVPGEQLIMSSYFVLRPIVPALAVPLSFLMSYANALAAANLCFLLLGTYVIYHFVHRVMIKREAAFAASICYASAFANLVFGVAVLADGAGFAMLIVSVYAILFLLHDTASSLVVGLIVGLSILTKETNLIAVIFLLIHYLRVRRDVHFLPFIVVAVISLGLAFSWSTLVGFSYARLYLLQFRYGTPGYKGALVMPKLAASQIWNAFNFTLPFTFMALFLVTDDQFKTAIECTLPALMLFIASPTYIQSRFVFLAFPGILPLAGFGIVEAADVLAKRPWFGKIAKEHWLLFLLFMIVLYTNVITFHNYFGTPISSPRL
jgi:hypothetical protein